MLKKLSKVLLYTGCAFLCAQMPIAKASPILHNTKMTLPAGVDLNPQVDTSLLNKECQNFINVVLPKFNWTGGFVQVPEDWSNPNGRTILAFYYTNLNSTSGSGDPIFFFNGGPIANYHSRLEPMNQQIQNYSQTALGAASPFLILDQRGTGCSTPNIPESSTVNVSQYKFYNSTSIAQDAEMIRLKLFPDKKIKIFAQSFGGPIAARYLDLFPASISQMHLYAPALYESYVDFFQFRIEKSVDVVQKFLQFYSQDQLERAFLKMASPEGQKYCIPDLLNKNTQVCGQPLLEVVMARIGQGKGRTVGGTEVWDSARDSLLNLIYSDSANDADPRKVAFINDAITSASFFQKPTIPVVISSWANEFSFLTGNIDDDCAEAHSRLLAKGIDPAKLYIDECRIIKSVIPDFYKVEVQKNYSSVKGNQFLTLQQINKLLGAQPQIKAYLYTGELDYVVQETALAPLIGSKNFNYQHIPAVGHNGWLFVPAVWINLYSN